MKGHKHSFSRSSRAAASRDAAGNADNAGDDYEGEVLPPQEGDDAPVHVESGEFFLKRYRQIAPDVRLLSPKEMRQSLRVNTMRITHDDLISQMGERGAVLERIPFLQNGFYATAKFSLGATPEYLFGYYYLQAPLSQLVCEVLAPPKGATVLDMAAAPGSKTTYLAMMVGADDAGGKVIALDNDVMRIASVRNNAERMGLANVICVKKDARFAVDFDTLFEYVLLDAPCSGNHCSEENWCGKRTIQDIKENARVQRELLRAAIACLAPGGRLVYSTCSLEPEEDEMMIDWALGKYPDMSVVSLDALPIGDAGATCFNGQELNPHVAGTRRFWPHKTGCEGFYIALLKKNE